MKVDVWRIQPKRADYTLLKNAPIILKMYCCCRKKIELIKIFYDRKL